MQALCRAFDAQCKMHNAQYKAKKYNELEFERLTKDFGENRRKVRESLTSSETFSYFLATENTESTEKIGSANI